MSATPGLRCPECGREAPEERDLFRTRRAPRLFIVMLLFLAMAYSAHVGVGVARRGTGAAVPTTALILGFPWLPQHMLVGTGETLAGRVQEGRLWGWQTNLLHWRCSRIIERSTDLDRIGAASWLVQSSAVVMPKVHMSREAQIEFFRRMAIDLKGGGISPMAALVWGHFPPVLDADVAAGAVPVIKDALASPSPGVGGYAIYLAGLLGAAGEELVPSLVTIYQNPSTWIHMRQAALASLANLAARSDVAWKACLAALTDPDPEIRQLAVGYASGVEGRGKELEQALIAALEDASDNVCVAAAQALLRLNVPACDWVPRLRLLLERSPQALGATFVDLAAACPCPEIVSGIWALVRWGEPEHIRVALMAARYLGIHGEAVVAHLRSVRDDDRFHDLKEDAEAAIGAIEDALKAARPRR